MPQVTVKICEDVVHAPIVDLEDIVEKEASVYVSIQGSVRKVKYILAFINI